VTQAHLRPDGEAIGLARGRCGARRGSELSPPERALYRWILRRFAGASTPRRRDVDHVAGEHGIVAEPALQRMKDLDLIQRGPDGTICCAYPFSAQPTGHTVEIEDGRPAVHAMCAIDALGIPFMLHRGGVVRATDPTTGRPRRALPEQPAGPRRSGALARRRRGGREGGLRGCTGLASITGEGFGTPGGRRRGAAAWFFR
jgi:hypothetical protein